MVNLDHVIRIRRKEDNALRFECSTGAFDVDFDNTEDRDENFEEIFNYLNRAK